MCVRTVIINDVPKRLPQYDDTKIFSETSILEWSDTITAQELLEQNTAEIAAYGAPQSAHVISSTTTLDGQPFSSFLFLS